MYNRTLCRLLLRTLAVLLVFLEVQAESFRYRDFNNTNGLVFNGAAFSSSCEDSQKGKEAKNHPAYAYQPNHGVEFSAADVFTRREGTDRIEEVTEEPSEESEGAYISAHTAGFGHRDTDHFDGFGDSTQVDCPVRLRLTPSAPYQRGSVWRTVGHHLIKGFTTEFEFQITDLSKTCSRVRDTSFSTRIYESCVVHGGDGFAFLIHADDNGTSALGLGGGQIGYGGMTNALAVEFDTRYNPDQVRSGTFCDGE